jgi:hypothetical protein
MQTAKLGNLPPPSQILHVSPPRRRRRGLSRGFGIVILAPK